MVDLAFLSLSISDRCFSLNIKQLYTILILLLLILFRTVSAIITSQKTITSTPPTFVYISLRACPPPPPRILYPPKTPCPFLPHLVHIISPAQLACLRTILAIYGQIFLTLPLQASWAEPIICNNPR